jgi:hypothetical protein
MPYWKRRFLSVALLMGGLSLGTLSLGEEYGGQRDSEGAPMGVVGFRHSVFLREEHTLHSGTPAPGRGVGRYGVHLQGRRKLQAPNGNVVRRAFQTPSPYAERRTLQAPNGYAERRVFESPNPVVTGGGELWVQPTSFTPYDRYMGTVRAVINHLEPRAANMSRARELMEEGRRFQYVTGDPYTANPPGVTAAVQAGDCKAKALWLYNGLGDADALFVIGKTTKYSRTSHAWVYWHNDNRWWILDCTNRSQPIAADSVSQDHYIPYYSYGRSGEYRHKATRLLIDPASPNSGAPAVADQAGK